MNKKNSIWLLVAVWTLVSCGTVKSTREKPAVALAQSSLTSEQQRKYDYFFLEAMRLKEKKDYASAFGLLPALSGYSSECGYCAIWFRSIICFSRQGAARSRRRWKKAVANAPDLLW